MTTTLGLGKMVMYGLSVHIHVPFVQFSKAAVQNGVPMDILPLPRSPIGAFKRSCTKVEQRSASLPEPITVKDIDSTIPDTVMRTFEKRLTSPEEDVKAMEQGQDYVPTYVPVITIMFNRKTLNLTYKTYKGTETEGQELFAKVMEEYTLTCGNANIQQFQETFRNAFRQYGSIKLMKQGNANFIPLKYEKEWANFSRFIKSFDGVTLNEYIMADCSENRETLKNDLLTNVNSSVQTEIKKLGKAAGSSELAELITEFGQALKDKQSSDKKIGNAAMTTILERYRTVMETVNLYKELLETDMSVVDSQIAIAQEQIVKLMQDAA